MSFPPLRSLENDSTGLMCTRDWQLPYSASSSQINGLDRDSAYIAKAMAARKAYQSEPAGVSA